MSARLERPALGVLLRGTFAAVVVAVAGLAVAGFLLTLLLGDGAGSDGGSSTVAGVALLQVVAFAAGAAGGWVGVGQAAAAGAGTAGEAMTAGAYVPALLGFVLSLPVGGIGAISFVGALVLAAGVVVGGARLAGRLE